MQATIILILFIVLSLAHVIGEAFKKKQVRYATKPLLLLSLGVYYYLSADVVNWFMVAAIIFGWLGDIFLMIPDPDKTRKYFKPGLVSFLLGHVFYTLVFGYYISSTGNFPWYGWLLFIPYILTGAVGFMLVKPHAGKMLGAFIAYVIFIVLMGISTVVPLGSVNFTGNILAMVGSLIFIVSDTINGYNKFAKEIPNERIYTMSTYLAGQFLLVQGYLMF